MIPGLVVLLGLVLLAIVLLIVRGGERDEDDTQPTYEITPARSSPFLRRYPLVPWIIGLSTAAVLGFLVSLVPWIACAIGLLAGIGARIGIDAWKARQAAQFELQLANGLDLIVGSLRAGAGVTEALTSATRAARGALKSGLSELVERIRIGDDPLATLADLESQYPLESFRLFTFTLAAHWEGGGSLASTLSNVGSTIRDRVSVRRRVRAQAVETQVSVLGILVVTYALALVMWNNYPERLDTFMGSDLGSAFVALTILLQAVGLFWISRMTRIEV